MKVFEALTKTAIICGISAAALCSFQSITGAQEEFWSVNSASCREAKAEAQLLTCDADPVDIQICGPLSECTKGDTEGSCPVQSCELKAGGGAVYCGPPTQEDACVYTHYEHDCAAIPFDHIAYTTNSIPKGCVYVTAY